MLNLVSNLAQLFTSAALYIYVRARDLFQTFRLAGSAALQAAVVLALVLLPVWVFSGPAGDAVPAFSFDAATGISNRFLTPNGDGRNDSVVLSFQNPADVAVAGRIYDLRGAFVAELATDPALDARFNRVWNGKSVNGQVVATGLYVYQLEAGEKAYAGVLVVIR